MRIKFWGVRGSYPVPGQTTNRYGGNTVCVQILPPGEKSAAVIVDAGTGIRRLGRELMSGPLGRGEGTCHLLISHTHWDHIQGLPFFAPLYVAGNRIHIYARQRDVHLRTIFRSQTASPYFSVSLEEVAAQVSYVELIEGAQFDLAGLRVSCARLNHPNISIGYRFENDRGAAAYVSDSAPFERVLLKDDYVPSTPANPLADADAAILRQMRQGVLDLCRDCDVVIYDTMFHMDEYLARPHWGHSTREHAVEIAEEAGARKLVLFHHAPERSDDLMDEDVADIRARTKLDIVAAAEGMVLDVCRPTKLRRMV